MYPEELVAPMREEAAKMGFREVHRAAEVQQALEADRTTLVLINSVCGCAAGMARPGAAKALAATTNRPDDLITVFAGNDTEAVAAARGYLAGYAPSSPAFALIRAGDVLDVVQRHDIEGHSVEEVAARLEAMLAEHCGKD